MAGRSWWRHLVCTMVVYTTCTASEEGRREEHHAECGRAPHRGGAGEGADRATTLNEQFRRWLAEYTAQERPDVDAAMELIERIRTYANTGGRKFTREEMNER